MPVACSGALHHRPAIAAVATALAIGSVAHTAEPVTLACDGKMSVIRSYGEVVEDYSLAVTVDLPARTVTVGGYGVAPISGDASRDTMVFNESGGRPDRVHRVFRLPASRSHLAVPVRVMRSDEAAT